jgi:DNA-binding transcriptional ArsR family regulator
MSIRPKRGLPPGGGLQAPVFAALGDATRMRLVGRLGLGEALSISELSEDSRLTRQAVTKHLHVLEAAHLVQGTRRGRQVLFTLTPQPIGEAMKYLEHVSAHWDEALARLKAFVETDPSVQG